MQIVHPDKKTGNHELAIKVIQAYKWLKSLAYENQRVTKDEQTVDIEKEFDIFELWEICPKCHGTKFKLFHTYGRSCPFCSSNPWGSFLFFERTLGRGSGFIYVPCRRCSGSGQYKDKGTCFNCNGSGVIKIRCKTCHGTGWLEDEVKKETCLKCNGKGKIILDPFNPVIPKGAILGKQSRR